MPEAYNFGPEIVLPNPPKLNRIDPPQKTFFYERKGGGVFACYENEAYDVHEHYSTHGRFLGSSDGTKYHGLVGEAKKKQDEALVVLEKKLKDSKTKLRVLSMRSKLTKKQEKEMEDYVNVQDNYDDLRKDIYRETQADLRAAFEAELAIAKGNLVGPGDMSTVYIGGQAQQAGGRINQLLNR